MQLQNTKREENNSLVNSQKRRYQHTVKYRLGLLELVSSVLYTDYSRPSPREGLQRDGQGEVKTSDVLTCEVHV